MPDKDEVFRWNQAMNGLRVVAIPGWTLIEVSHAGQATLVRLDRATLSELRDAIDRRLKAPDPHSTVMAELSKRTGYGPHTEQVARWIIEALEDAGFRIVSPEDEPPST